MTNKFTRDPNDHLHENIALLLSNLVKHKIAYNE